MLLEGLFSIHFYGFLTIKVVKNDQKNGCNLQTGYKTKLIKHGGAGQ